LTDISVAVGDETTFRYVAGLCLSGRAQIEIVQVISGDIEKTDTGGGPARDTQGS